MKTGRDLDWARSCYWLCRQTEILWLVKSHCRWWHLSSNLPLSCRPMTFSAVYILTRSIPPQYFLLGSARFTEMTHFYFKTANFAEKRRVCMPGLWSMVCQLALLLSCLQCVCVCVCVRVCVSVACFESLANEYADPYGCCAWKCSVFNHNFVHHILSCREQNPWLVPRIATDCADCTVLRQHSRAYMLCVLL